MKFRTKLVLALVISALLVLVVMFIIVPANRHNEALAHLDSYELEKARSIFAELGSFRNADSYCAKIDDYSKALVLLDSAKPDEAYAIFADLVDFLDSDEYCGKIESYNQALVLANSGNSDEAYGIFTELDGFLDSELRRKEIDYLRAKLSMDEGRIKDAYLLLSAISGYKDSQELLLQLEQLNPYLPITLSACGDIVTLGEYEQNNRSGNGKEPIEWIVLHNEDGAVFMLSKYVLDAQPFNEADRHACSLDIWLKSDFSNAAFGNVPEGTITRVGLLHEDDIEQYVLTGKQLIGKYTSYAFAQEPTLYFTFDRSDSGYAWWLTGETYTDYKVKVNAPVVFRDDKGSAVVTDNLGVRPVVWLFADPEDIPPEPEFDGSAPKKYIPKSYGSSLKGSICSWCGGDGMTHDWGTEMHGDGYKCWKCNGDGWLSPDD